MDKNRHIYIILMLIALFLLNVREVQGQGNITVGHQVGEFYRDLLPNGMQKTNTHRTTIYIKPGEARSLSIPTSGGAAPHSYSRWYDYTSNTKSNRLGSFTGSVGVDYLNGRFYWNSNGNDATKMATYTAPSEIPENEAIAVDVSAYIDWTNGTYLTVEPTLSYRWIFDIKDANIIANDIKKATEQDKYLEEHDIYMPIYLPIAKHNPRVTLEYARSNYYIQPKGTDIVMNTSSSAEKITTQEQEISETSSTTEPGDWSRNNNYTFNGTRNCYMRTVTETGIEYSSVRTETVYNRPSFIFEGNTTAPIVGERFIYISLNEKPDEVTAKIECDIDANTQKYRRTRTRTYREYSQNKTDIVGTDRYSNWTNYSNRTWVTTSNTTTIESYNIARFKMTYQDAVPMDYNALEEHDITATDDEKRSLKNLEENYVLINKLDFDYNTDPADKHNNMWLMPIEWNYCSYGFTSGSLQMDGKRKMSGCAAEQNEYGFYKTANIDDISKGGISGVTITPPKATSPQNGNYSYTWYNDSKKVRDRLYYESKGKKAGYFMYIDASDQPGVVAKLPLENALCAGTKLIVSAGVCSLTKRNATNYPNLNFIFKGVDKDGNETELNRYTTGDIPSYTGSNDTPWYQVFYSFSYTSEVEYESFLLQVDNNANGTSGADYAIDDIRVYRSKPTVQANQIELPCGVEEEAKIKIRIGYDKLISDIVDPTSNNTDIEIHYQFMDADKKAITGYNYHEGNGEEPFYEYGTIWIKNNREDMESWNASENDFDELPLANGKDVFAKIEYVENDPQGQYYYVVFRSPNNKVLKYNYEYHTTVANREGQFETGLCSLISDPFVIQKPTRITVDGAAVVNGKGICYGSPIELEAALYDRINREPIEPCMFDWYLGQGYSDISEALSHYREEDAYPSYVGDIMTELQSAKGSFTQEDHDKLAQAIANRQLYLNRKTITYRVMKGDVILAKPIVGSTGKKDDPNFNICNNVIELDTSGETSMPDIEIGQGIQPKGIRMNLDQLTTLKTDTSKELWVPVGNFENSDKTHNYEIVQSNDPNNLYEDKTGIVYLKGTDDPGYADVDFTDVILPQLARLKVIEVGPGKEDYLVFAFNSGNFGEGEITMREGYTYQLMFFYNEKNTQTGGNGNLVYSVCNGMTLMNIKVVPKYLTWTGKKGDNWNNNKNWRRSTRDELYKGETYDETDKENTRGFVPMHTTLTTIADVTPAPWLYQLTLGSGSAENIDANTNHPVVGNDSTYYKANAPSDSIQYELEAWKGSEINKEKYEYACRLFKGNSCQEVYFKPKAEMRNTHYLKYQKAWIDFELNNNRWYMLASPLQGIVAGDMYLPTQGGRQETEVFQPINYVQGTINNRFDPAVYQRNWSKDGAENFRPETGSYTVSKVGDWSGAYNKVSEAYKEGEGFSIRPIYFEDKENNGNKEIKEDHQVLFRLPKADTGYDYYAYGSDNILDSGKRWESGGRTTNGKLALTPGAETITVQLVNNHDGDGQIFLAGNPFMATLNMTAFFDKNESSTDEAKKMNREYSILTEQGQCYFSWNDGSKKWESSIQDINGGVVAPLQGFFVTKTVKGGNIEVTYSPDMTIAKPSDSRLYSQQTRSTDDGIARLYVKAERKGFHSHILIVQQAESDNGYREEEDVATFIDSNLKETPTLYSVAGNTVVSINRMSNQELIPLGIYSENEEEVTLSFSGVETFGKEIELYDAELKTRTILEENATFTVPVNTHGRYFVSLERSPDNKQADGEITVYSPEANKVIVSASLNNKLQGIQVYNVSGIMVRDLTNLNSVTEELNLPGGMYIVRTQSQTGNSTAKVMVKEQ